MEDKEVSAEKKIQYQIDIWLNRALMAFHEDRMDLSKTALEKRWEYQKKLALLEGTDPPPPPPEPKDFFEGLGGGSGPRGPRNYDPNQTAPVPRRPLPSSGSGEIVLPLPESGENDT
jgi:hypothetical protein